jgi:hypothetical protein
VAEREKLLGVLWPALQQAGAPVPSPVAAAMRRHALVTTFRMGALETQLRNIIGVLNAHDVPVMLLKGSALALTVYGSFARRPMGDLDLLVHASQAQAAWALLRAAGWTPEMDDREGVYDTHQHLCPLVAPGGAGVVVELHRSLVHPQGPFRLGEDAVWAAAAPVAVGGNRALVPSTEHQVLLLCIHFAWMHAMQGGLGRTTRDLGVLAPRVDWPALVALARETRAESCCYWTLRLAASLAGVAVPRDVLRSLAPRWPEPALRALERVIATDAFAARQEFTPSVGMERAAWMLAIRPRASGHGDARPWCTTEGLSRMLHVPPPPSLARRLQHQVAQVPRWMRYLQVLAGIG